MILDRLAFLGLTNAALATLLAALLWLAYRRIKAPQVVRLLAVVVLLRFLAPPVLPWGLLPGRYAPGAAAVQTIPSQHGPEGVSLAVENGELEVVAASTEGPFFDSGAIYVRILRIRIAVANNRCHEL